MTPTPDQVRALEKEVAQIKNVDFCSILLDGQREVKSIDVVSDVHRAPQRIVRDVEIILRKHGLDVDHRKIGVVQMEEPQRLRPETPQPTTSPSSAPVPPRSLDDARQETASPIPAILELVPESERVRLSAVHSTTRDGSFAVEVELTFGPYEGMPGRAEGPAGEPASAVALVARATLDAVRNLLQPGYEALLREARVQEAGGLPIVLVVAEFGKGRDVQSVVGACPQRGTLYETAVYATLDAINRPLGQAHFRELAYLEGRSEEGSGGAAAVSA
jgi:hypothetical protein